MYKDEVVALMTDYINKMNRTRAEEMLVPSEQIDEMELQSTPEFNRVNGEIYDMLVDNGVIR